MQTPSLNPGSHTIHGLSPRTVAWRFGFDGRLLLISSSLSSQSTLYGPQNEMFMLCRFAAQFHLKCFQERVLFGSPSSALISWSGNVLPYLKRLKSVSTSQRVKNNSSGVQCVSDISSSKDRVALDPGILFSFGIPTPPQQVPSSPPTLFDYTFEEEEEAQGESPEPSKMTVTSEIKIVDGKLMVKGKTILTQVPKNIVLTASTGTVAQGIFLGASSSDSSSRHVFPLGLLKDLRFMCCFRFSLWWMTQRMGLSGKDVPLETQFLLLESKDVSHLRTDTELVDCGNQTVYTVLLPLLDGSFRASLQGGENDELQLCTESGDASVTGTGGHYSVFLHTGIDPFQVVADAVQAVEMHMQTFRRREEKKMPGILDWFGWCTWDAFYTDVNPEGVKAGLKSLGEGGTPARLVIIDDGWQSVASDDEEPSGELSAGTQFARRLTDIKENYKFRKDGKNGSRLESTSDLKHIIKEIKEEHDVKYVYVWHALAGYWGGVRPDGAETEKYESAMKYPMHSPGVLGNQPNMALDSLTVNGLGLVHPKKVFEFYNELHSYLAAAGVDGVKVDVQNIIETLGTGFGGRVSLTRQYHQSLEASLSRNFPDNGCIACMSHNTDGLYSIKQTAVVRASDDFWPRDPASHTIHIASVAYNSIFLGEFMQPDWDMFQSLHPAAEYHAAARAIGGCPVYVSDRPGYHDFNLLKRLVLPDGSILRAQLPGRPTRDSLFTDPARDGKSLLKIWNMNKYTGVLGAFNCQGAGWCQAQKVNVIHDTAPATITGSVCRLDVDWLAKITPEGWDGDCALFTHKGGELICLSKSALLPITLKVLEYEVYTISPIKKVGSGVAFAPIGLLKMFNSGGAIVSLDYQLHENNVYTEFKEKPLQILDYAYYEVERAVTAPIVATISMKIHGCGEFGVYSSVKPKECWVDSAKVDFTYNAESGLVAFLLPATKKSLLQDVVIEV